MFFPQGSHHAFKNVGATTAKILLLFFPAGFENYLKEVGTPVVEGQEAPYTDLSIAARIASNTAWSSCRFPPRCGSSGSEDWQPMAMSTPADESPPEGTSASVELAPQPARGGWHFAEWLSELAGTTILVFVGLSAVTLVFAQGSALAPFIYTLF